MARVKYLGRNQITINRYYPTSEITVWNIVLCATEGH